MMITRVEDIRSASTLLPLMSDYSGDEVEVK